MVVLEILYNSSVHITKLATVAFVKNDDNVFPIHFMFAVFFDEGRQLLNGSNDNMGIRIFQLLFKNCSRSIAVGSTFFKAVILLHGLVVQVLTVNHKQHLINIRQL